jgi:hypothetical protein
MNLKQLAAKPQLIKINIDNEEIVKEYGDSLDFYTWDRQPLDTFLKVATSEDKSFASMAGVLKDMVLNEDGTPAIEDGYVLPPKVMIAVFTKMVEVLGK